MKWTKLSEGLTYGYDTGGGVLVLVKASSSNSMHTITFLPDHTIDGEEVVPQDAAIHLQELREMKIALQKQYEAQREDLEQKVRGDVEAQVRAKAESHWQRRLDQEKNRNNTLLRQICDHERDIALLRAELARNGMTVVGDSGGLSVSEAAGGLSEPEERQGLLSLFRRG